MKRVASWKRKAKFLYRSRLMLQIEGEAAFAGMNTCHGNIRKVRLLLVRYFEGTPELIRSFEN